MAKESDDDQVSDAGEAGVLVSALGHPMVLAALSRMASSGAWQRVIDREPLTEEIDVLDAEFLLAAGAVSRVVDDTFKLAVSDSMYGDCQVLAHRTQYLLRRALRHATGRSIGWASEDPETVLSFGRATGSGADIIADLLLPQLPMSSAAFTEEAGCSSMSGSASQRSRSASSTDTPARVPLDSTFCRRCSGSQSPKLLGMGCRGASSCDCSQSLTYAIGRTTTWRGSRSRSSPDPRS